MNQLSRETSPYLLQHAANPVDWYPWGEAALNRARQEGKPVLLSIGYSACHWCHVMAHESFEDPAIAAVMNRLFINIKVDREERPDIDKLYQLAHQLITRRNGGWPLTVFLTPDEQLPFFAGTYFPAEARYGMPAFAELLHQIAAHFEANREDMQAHGTAVVRALASLEPPPPAAHAQLDRSPLEGLRQQLADNFDRDFGGFGGAPKFPHPTSLEFLLRHWRASAHSAEPDVDALFMVALTLTRMLEGGVYDHLGGGFFRYAVDREWHIPHFEKMLYDNGPLLALLVQLWQASGDELFRRGAEATADWVLRDMRSPEGGFWSSLDADSGGEEGRFYAWDAKEVATVLDQPAYAAFAQHYGLNQAPNFEGRWHLLSSGADEPADSASPHSPRRALLETARGKLLAVRNQREWPGRDEKVLVSWNALMIRGLTLAGRVLEREDCVEAAINAADFIQRHMHTDGRLLAVYKDGQARFPAYLDDYAFMLDALLELLQTRWHSRHLQFAVELADYLLDAFEDPESGGFFFTSTSHEQLAHRTRSFSDDSLPSGNGIVALALGRLGHLLAETRYLQAAERTLRAGLVAMQDFPHGHAALITALDEYLQPPEILVIRGTSDEAEDWARAVRALYAPRRMVFVIPAGCTDLPGALEQRRPLGQTAAYLCRGTQCEAPLTRLDELTRAVRES